MTATCSTSTERMIQEEADELVARGRTGRLSARRVRLAAHLGDQAARLALHQPLEGPGAPDDPFQARRALRTWLVGFQAWGQEVWVRAAAAAALLAVVDWNERHPGDSSPQRALDTVQRWLSCPCGQHAADASAAAAGVSHARVDFAASAALHAAKAAAETDPQAALRHAILAAEDAAWVVGCHHTVREVIRRALTPWALGYTTAQAA